MGASSPLLIGLGAGLVSGVLFASAATGSALAMALFYLAPLPGFLAGLGWGWAAAGLAGAAGATVVGLALGFKAAASYAVSLGLPIAILCYLALLAREATGPGPASAAGAAPAVEWYPPGRLVSWTTLMAGTLAAGSVPLLGTDFESYRATVQEVIETGFLKRMGTDAEIDKQRLQSLIDVLVHVLPAASAVVWQGVATFNMWAAGRIVDYSGRALRPWPDLATMAYPNFMAWGFVGSLLLSFMPGLAGIVASAFAGALLLAYTLLGLVIVHVVTRGTPLRPVLLGGIYLSLLMFGWVALIVAIVGVGEPIFKLRAKALGKTMPPGRT